MHDRGESYCYAVIVDGILSGVCGTQKQYKGSQTPGGMNINALNSQMLTDFGLSPTFYSCLVEIERAKEQKYAPSQPFSADGAANPEINPAANKGVTQQSA